MRIHIDPERWADRTGCDPARCQYELGCQLSDAIDSLPIMEDNWDIRVRGRTVPPDPQGPALDGTVQVTVGYLIDYDAERWWAARAEGIGPAALDTPRQRRAYDDMVLHLTAELGTLWTITETGARVTLLEPYRREFQPGELSELSTGTARRRARW
ncbi:hypothetical protein [Actinomadura opuntiae]|uniref:hypothetical protein n=1 Tax=Actinomadura sp. OS1-43 TaxID=604315 RepID=UPI00255AEB9B|nr:hypothetical protein [Actinomadura sp. OS1-43]MDL4812768.1 hypothetical protein [Actinomadura sp. OS1-43]